jgi:hypothetical protein
MVRRVCGGVGDWSVPVARIRDPCIAGIGRDQDPRVNANDVPVARVPRVGREDDPIGVRRWFRQAAADATTRGARRAQGWALIEEFVAQSVARIVGRLNGDAGDWAVGDSAARGNAEENARAGRRDNPKKELRRLRRGLAVDHLAGCQRKSRARLAQRRFSPSLFVVFAFWPIQLSVPRWATR